MTNGSTDVGSRSRETGVEEKRINYAEEIAAYVNSRRSGVSITDSSSGEQRYRVRQIRGIIDDGRILNVRTTTPVPRGRGKRLDRKLEVELTPTKPEHIGYRIEVGEAYGNDKSPGAPAPGELYDSFYNFENCDFTIRSGLRKDGHGIIMSCDTDTHFGAGEEFKAVLRYVHGILTTPGALRQEEKKK